MAQQSFEIKAGPSKFDLSVALFHRPIVGQHHVVLFTIQGEYITWKDIEAVITGVTLEDGSRESWNICGWIKDGMNTKFTAYFETRRRTGTMHFHN